MPDKLNHDFPNVEVDFSIVRVGDDGTEAVVHRGTYRLAVDSERVACGQRFHQCIAEGLEVRTRRKKKTKSYNRARAGNLLGQKFARN